MSNLSKYELAEDRYNSLISGGMSEKEALTYMVHNIGLYILVQNVDTPQDRILTNVQYTNLLWYTKTVLIGK
jgi:hypothetical protein